MDALLSGSSGLTSNRPSSAKPKNPEDRPSEEPWKNGYKAARDEQSSGWAVVANSCEYALRHISLRNLKWLVFGGLDVFFVVRSNFLVVRSIFLVVLKFFGWFFVGGDQ